LRIETRGGGFQELMLLVRPRRIEERLARLLQPAEEPVARRARPRLARAAAQAEALHHGLEPVALARLREGRINGAAVLLMPPEPRA